MSRTRIAITYVLNVVVFCVVISLWEPTRASGIRAAIWLLCVTPLLSLVETLHGISKAVLLFSWWDSSWELSVNAAATFLLLCAVFATACFSIRHNEIKRWLAVSHLLLLAYWISAVFLTYNLFKDMRPE